MIITIKDKSTSTLQFLKVFALCFFSFFLIVFSFWFLLLILTFPLIIMYQEGVEIDTNRQMFRRYQQRFNKKGDWKTLGYLTEVVVKPYKGKRRIYHAHYWTAQEYDEFVYDVYLMDKYHLKKLFLRSFKSEKKAFGLAEMVSSKLSFALSKYKVKPFPTRRKR